MGSNSVGVGLVAGVDVDIGVVGSAGGEIASARSGRRTYSSSPFALPATRQAPRWSGVWQGWGWGWVDEVGGGDEGGVLVSVFACRGDDGDKERKFCDVFDVVALWRVE